MALYNFEETFLKYFKPFAKIIKREIEWAKARPAGDTRPAEVKTGDLWTNTSDGKEYYHAGGVDYLADTTRPAGLADGDKWYSMAQTPSMIVKVEGDEDLAYVSNIRNLSVQNQNDTGSNFNTDGERITLSAKADTATPATTDLNIYNDGSRAEWRLLDNEVVKGAIRIDNDGKIYSNDKLIVTENYDPLVTTIELTDHSAIDGYITGDSDLGGTPNHVFFKANAIRQGNVLHVNGRYRVDGLSYNEDSDATIVIKLDVIKLLKDQGWFDVGIDIKGYFTGNIYGDTDSSDRRVSPFIGVVNDKNSSSPNAIAIVLTESPWQGNGETIERLTAYFSFTCAVTDN